MHPKVISQETEKKWHWNFSLGGQAVFKLWIKMLVLINKLKNCLELKNHLAYSNFDTIFEFFGQFTMDAYIIFQKGVDNFEIGHLCLFLLVVEFPHKSEI